MKAQDTFIGKLVIKRIYSVKLRTEVLEALQHQIDHGIWVSMEATLLGRCFIFEHTPQGHEYWLKIHDMIHGPDSLSLGRDLYFQNIERNKL